MTEYRFRAIKCPRCGDSVNGRTCPTCGLEVGTKDVTKCYGCGATTLEDEATKERYQHPVTAHYQTVYFCGDCR